MAGPEPVFRSRIRRLGDYARAFRVFHRDSTAAEMSYSGNLAAGVVLSLFWMIWAIVGLRLFFIHVPSLHGWNFDEALLVLALFFTVNGVRQALFQPNMKRMTQYIQQGTLDLFLVKPISTQFLVSFRYINAVSWTDCGWGILLAVYALVRVGYVPSLQNVVQFICLLAAAVVLLYCLSFGLQTLTLWTVQSKGLDDLVHAILEISRYPTYFYGSTVGFLFKTVVPVAFLTTVPSEALLGHQGWATVLAAAALAAASVAITRGMWVLALRSYQGVSG
ncbi:ABC transporter permease [Streptomyces sp. NPDC056909]|uniref:ABC transporter permease n=1 Tax=Streptomyces sp. NPDC056909 TaxID=3345963 RepID=UPI003691A09A